VVRSWLRDGADGWRLDVAFDIGFVYLQELTAAAHAEKPGSLVVGEIANYPGVVPERGCGDALQPAPPHPAPAKRPDRRRHAAA
jgi:hypothetical protein